MRSGGAPGKLPVLALLADAARAYRSRWKILIGVALVILLPQAIGHAIGIDVEIDLDHFQLRRQGATILAAAAVVAIGLAGEALYAGVITTLVVEWRFGLPRTEIGRLVRSLPYLQLIIADIVIVAGIVLGLVVLIVPGVLFATYFLVTTVMIELEHLSVRRGLARSAGLVRGSFWRVLAIVLVVMVGTEGLGSLIEAPAEHTALEGVTNLVVQAMLEPFQGVATVLVALGLMELRGERPRGATRERARTRTGAE